MGHISKCRFLWIRWEFALGDQGGTDSCQHILYKAAREPALLLNLVHLAAMDRGGICRGEQAGMHIDFHKASQQISLT